MGMLTLVAFAVVVALAVVAFAVASASVPPIAGAVMPVVVAIDVAGFDEIVAGRWFDPLSVYPIIFVTIPMPIAVLPDDVSTWWRGGPHAQWDGIVGRWAGYDDLVWGRVDEHRSSGGACAAWDQEE